MQECRKQKKKKGGKRKRKTKREKLQKLEHKINDGYSDAYGFPSLYPFLVLGGEVL
jgi:hypothetical protein